MDVVTFVNSQPANQRFGIEMEKARDGHAVGTLAFDEDWCFSSDEGEYLHGGVSFGLADTVGAAAVMSKYERVQPAVTVNLSIDYLEVIDDDLRAEAEINRYGGSTASVDIEVYSGDADDPAVLARGVYATE